MSNNFKNRVNNSKKVTAASALIGGSTKKEMVEEKEVVRRTTSLTLDVELMADVKIFALKNKRNMYEVLETALKEYLSK